MAWTPNGQVGLCGSHLDNSPLGDQVFFGMLDMAGYLDPGFDTDGSVTHDVCTTTERCTDMVVQTVGRLLGIGHQYLSGAIGNDLGHRRTGDGAGDAVWKPGVMYFT